MESTSKLQIYSVEESSETAAICIVRCVGGIVRTGQVFSAEAPAVTADAGISLTLTAIDRYGREVELFDPPHAAKVHLSGPGASLLGRGLILVAGDAADPGVR